MVAVGAGSATAGVTYTTNAGLLIVSTGHSVDVDLDSFELPEVAGLLVESDLTLPEDARVEAATFTLTARPSGLTRLSSVAQVRPSTGFSSDSAATADFGRFVTVGGVGFDVLAPLGLPNISRVLRWTGSTWSSLSISGSFAEIATDRLLVETTNTGVTSDDLAEALAGFGTVELPALPTALELLVDGTTVWFERQGSAAGAAPDAPEGGIAFVVDRTDAVREALARAPVVDGERTIRVALRAASPGTLQLSRTLGVLRVHLVPFPPEGVTRSFELAEEGVQRVDVSPPSTAEEVREVSLVVRGSFGPERVQPPVGPTLVGDATLALAVARTVLVGVPAVLSERFAKVVGLRVPIVAAAGGSGGEIGGRLLADDGGRPGTPVPGGDLTPFTVAAGTDTWITLPFPKPVELAETAEGATAAAWLELQLTYGEVELRLTTAAADDPAAPGGPLLRRLPGGGTTGLTTVPAFGPLRAGIRLVGLADRDRAIPAVTLAVSRSDVEVGVNPSGDDLPAILTLGQPVRTAEGPVELVATVAAPGSLTFDTVRVAYSEGVGS